MPTLQDRLSDLATRAATESKSLRTLLNGNAATLAALATTDKTNLVNAINEVRGVAVAATTINDSTTSGSSTWSSTKISGEISGAVSGLVASAPAALDTLVELAAALGNDANFSTTVSTALGNRLRVDTAAQGLNGTQQSNARTNLGLGTLATQNGTFSGSSSGTNTGDQTITLTGDVTGSGTGSFAATIASGAVTNAKLATVATATIKGRVTAGNGAPEDLTASQVRTLLNVADGATANTGTVTSVSGTGTASGLSLSGTVTTSGNITLSGTVTPAWGNITSVPAAISSVAALTPAADRLPYYTSASAAALATITTFGRNLIDDADAAAARATLGLGDAALGTAVTSQTDVTANSILRVGWQGLGARYAPLVANIDDATLRVGFYIFNMTSGTTGTSPGFNVGALIVASGIGSGTDAPQQIAVERTSSAGGRMAWRTSQGGTYGAWQTVCSLDAIGNPDTNFVSIFEAGLV